MAQLDLVGSDSLVSCDRCGTPVKFEAPPTDPAKMLRRAKKPEGNCVNCAVAEWFVLYGLRESVPDPKALLAKHVQEQFVRVMGAAGSHARPEEINWQHVVANWHLPFRTKARRGKR